MKIITSLRRAAAIAAAFTFASAPLRAATPPEDQETGFPRLEMLAQALDVTDAQRQEIKQILQEARPVTQPLVQRVVETRRALEDQVQIQPVNEAAIRSRAAELATAQADLAVQRSRIHEQLAGVLTEKQLTRAEALRSSFRERADRLMARLAGRLPQP